MNPKGVILRQLSAVAIYGVCAAVLSWPMLTHIASHIPQGHESSGTVPLFNIWTLLWNADRILHFWSGYWDAPIFYGVSNSFALSEPQPATGLMFAPIYWITQNPALAYNLVLLSILVLNGVALRHLVLRLDVESGIATLAGVFGVALPFAWWELGVLQLTVLFPPLFAFAALIEYHRYRRWRAVLSLATWTALSFLTCSYYGLFLALLLPVAAVFMVDTTYLSGKTVVQMVGGAALAVALTAPVILPQYQASSNFERSEKTIHKYSAATVDWGRLDDRSVGATLVPRPGDDRGSGNCLYPGTALLALGALGYFVGRRTRHRRLINALSAVVLVGFVLSLGLRLDLAGFRPYELVREYVPGYTNLRSPFRFAALVQIGLAALAGLGVAVLWRWNRFAAASVVLVHLIETAALPQVMTRFPNEALRTQWVNWLADARPAPVVMLPLPGRGGSKNYYPTTVAMLQALTHGKPMVEGYSGLFPRRMQDLRDNLREFPDIAAINYLQQLGVGYIVIPAELITTDLRRRLDAAPDLQSVFVGPEKHIYRLLAPSGG